MDKSDPVSRLWERAFYIIAAILFMITFTEASAKMNERTFKLPKTVGIWTRPDSPQMVNSSNIFDYMDGAGELYLAYRFKKLEVYKYTATGREYIEVEIYFMETPNDAFGLLSHDWGGESVDLRASRPETIKASRPPLARALYGAGLLRIWSGSVYARIMATRQTPESKKAVLSLGRTIAGWDKLSNEPDLLNVLTDEIADGWKLKFDSIRYFHTQLVLNIFYYLSLENILNLDRSAEAVTATYEKTGGEKSEKARILFVKYSTPEKASRALDLFRQSYIPESAAANTKIGTNEEPAFFQVEDGWL
ncbi:MAG: hypothetical protein A2031_03120, partial [Deltaproteobacteria bacterium RBG_19FT_COMBO_43_11]